MIVALLGALVIGMSLGLLGSGGSILCVPVLVFILHRPEKVAIAESLAIVGGIALMGSLPYVTRMQVDWRSVLFFGLPGMLGAWMGGCCSYFISGTIQVILFALVMFVVAGMMLFTSPKFEKTGFSSFPIWSTMLQGFFVGGFTGFIGIGGGFLIVPVLVLCNNLSMSLAVGTSLIIIAINSLTGFFGRFLALNSLQIQVNWEMIVMISLVGILGSFTGSFLAKKISQIHLRQLFGLSILALAVFMLLQHV